MMDLSEIPDEEGSVILGKIASVWMTPDELAGEWVVAIQNFGRDYSADKDHWFRAGSDYPYRKEDIQELTAIVRVGWRND